MSAGKLCFGSSLGASPDEKLAMAKARRGSMAEGRPDRKEVRLAQRLDEMHARQARWQVRATILSHTSTPSHTAPHSLT